MLIVDFTSLREECIVEHHVEVRGLVVEGHHVDPHGPHRDRVEVGGVDPHARGVATNKEPIRGDILARLQVCS